MNIKARPPMGSILFENGINKSSMISPIDCKQESTAKDRLMQFKELTRKNQNQLQKHPSGLSYYRMRDQFGQNSVNPSESSKNNQKTPTRIQAYNHSFIGGKEAFEKTNYCQQIKNK